MTVDVYRGLATQIATAAFLFVAAYVLGRVVGNVLKRTLRRTGMYETDAIVVSSASKYLVWLIGVFVALGHLSIQITPYLVALLVATLVLTWMVARAPLENVVSWYLLRNWGQFAVGDFVEISDVEGVVRSLDLLQLTVETADNRYCSIPNAKVVSLGGYKLPRKDNFCPVRERLHLRRDIDVNSAKLKLLEIVQAFPHLSFDKPVKIMVDQVTDNNVVLEVLFWVPRLVDVLPARDYISTRVLAEMMQAPGHRPEEALHDVGQPSAPRPQQRAVRCPACGSTAWKGFLRCTDSGCYYVFGRCMDCDQQRLDRCPADGGTLEFVSDEKSEVRPDA